MAAENDANVMDVDQGGSVQAQRTCLHTLQSISMPQTLDSFPDLASSTECTVDKCTHTESWVCCKCFKIFCGRYGEQHMIQHKTQHKDHCIAMGCGDLSFWCYACDDYLHHLHIRRIFELYKIAHVRKFKHEINNLEQLMEQTNFKPQDQLEKKLTQITEKKLAPAKWYKGTEILSRKWNKKDAIEYDSDPDHKQKDNKPHVHKGIILKINANKGHGKIVIKDDSGGYGNYGLETIKIKLPPADAQNTVQRKASKKVDALYSTQTVKKQRTAKGNKKNTSNKGYDYSQYRGYDDNDEYIAPVEYIPVTKLKYRKIQWSKGSEIEYDSDPESKDTINNHLHKGQIVNMDIERNVLEVKLTTGHSVRVDLNKVWIGVNKLFWCCGLCGFENSNKTTQCMVCRMNDVQIKKQSMRPQLEKKEEESKDNDDDLPHDFFVYGTLRDDDDSGALWAAGWAANCIAHKGRIRGYKLYQKKIASYPFLVQTGNMEDIVIGRIVTWKDRKVVVSRRERADRIEGIKKGQKAGSLFQRGVIEAENMDENGKKVKAVFYYKEKPDDLKQSYYVEIPNGDWLQRDRT